MVKEKYLPFEEPPQKEEPSKTPKEIRKEKWSNFWYYNKAKILIGAVIVVVLGYSFGTAWTTPKPDYTVGMLTSTQYPTDFIDELEKQLSYYGEDLNGDGQVLIQVQEYVMQAEDGSALDPSLLAASTTRFAGDAQMSGMSLYIADQYNLHHYAEVEQYIGYLDTTPLKEGEKPETEEIGINWKDTEICEGNEILNQYVDLAGDLYFCLRGKTGVAEEKYAAASGQGVELFQRVVSGEKAAGGSSSSQTEQ